MTRPMTATAAVARSSTPTRRDLRAPSKLALAIIAPIGPLAVAVLRLALPSFDTTTTEGTVRTVLDHPGQQSLVLWMGLIAVLTLVPTVLAIGRLTKRYAPNVTAIAMVLLVLGYVSLGWMAGTDQLLWSGAHAGLGVQDLTRLADAAHPTTDIAGTLFIAGHVFGTILLGVALWISRKVPRWAAAVTIIAQPLHFTAFIIVGSQPLDFVAWTLNAVGFAAAAVAIVRLPVDEWDLPPAGIGR